MAGAPILSVAISSDGKLATGGGDCFVRIWMTTVSPTGEVEVQFLSALRYHDKPVNCVRFSGDEKTLASAGDDGCIVLWKLDDTQSVNQFDLKDDNLADNVERWKTYRTFLGSKKGILDLSWSPNSQFLLSGSIDNSLTIWNTKDKSARDKILEFCDHHHFVQGVCWDPLNEYITSHSSDKTARFYSNNKSKVVRKNSFKSKNIPLRTLKHKPSESSLVANEVFDSAAASTETETAKSSSIADAAKGEIKYKETKLFYDENVNTFFRRPCWSPDGNLVFLPCGQYSLPDSKDSINVTYAFSRDDITRPLLCIPTCGKPSVAVRFSPVLYRLRENVTETTGLDYPYRMIFAVAFSDGVTIHDTQSLKPLYRLVDAHYAPLTDISWSPNGRMLVMSSMDGFCTFITFDAKELGEPLPASESAKILERINEAKVQDLTITSGDPSSPKSKGSTPQKTNSNTKKTPPSSNNNNSDTSNNNSNVSGESNAMDIEQQNSERKRKIELKDESPSPTKVAKTDAVPSPVVAQEKKPVKRMAPIFLGNNNNLEQKITPAQSQQNMKPDESEKK